MTQNPEQQHPNSQAVKPEQDYSAVDRYLAAGMQNQATTIYMFPGAGITYRVGNKLLTVPNTVLTAAQTTGIVLEILPAALLEDPSQESRLRYLDRVKSIEFSHSIQGVARFRVHVFRQRGSLALCIRVIPQEVPDLSRFHVPDDFIQGLKQLKGGLYIVHGKLRSGKSSLLGAIVDHINKTQSRLIVLLEPTIQFSHRNAHSLITQREAGFDTASLAHGIKEALRQDQDIIVADELSDAEMFDRVMEGVLKGVTVFLAMGTPDVEKTIQHLLNFKPPSRQLDLINDLMTHLRALLTTDIVTDANGHRDVKVQYVPANLLNSVLLSRRTDLEQKGSSRSMMEEMGGSSSVDQSWFENE